MKKILTKKGFTLIELIVVIAILAILAAILIPSLVNYLDEAKIARGTANTRSQYTAAMLDLSVDGSLDGTYSGCTPVVTLGVMTGFSCVEDGRTFTINVNTGAITVAP